MTLTLSPPDSTTTEVAGNNLLAISSFGLPARCAPPPDQRGQVEPDRKPLVVDWDELDAQRVSLFP